mmetsp:Transcript_12000/g.33019  ORF Transcript_12000/g.33019 Transcript_12000/m.33019 type:complete len:93 (-) Transcript_12000:247-525(-)
MTGVGVVGTSFMREATMCPERFTFMHADLSMRLYTSTHHRRLFLFMVGSPTIRHLASSFRIAPITKVAFLQDTPAYHQNSCSLIDWLSHEYE